ncbi:MAG: hypothetical protein ABI742_01225 [Gemmatimonadota bacterium]
MHTRSFTGSVVTGLGAIVLLHGGSYTTRQQVPRADGQSIATDQRESIAPWVGGLVVVTGLALIVASARQPSPLS